VFRFPDRGSEEINVGFRDFGAGSRDKLRDPRLVCAGNDRKFSLRNEFHMGTLFFSSLRGIRPMIETVPLVNAAEAYGRMMRNEARFRIVLVTVASSRTDRRIRLVTGSEDKTRAPVGLENLSINQEWIWGHS
jgi:hypothetical protein